MSLPYLTPQRYRSMGFGTDSQEDAELRSIIQRATLSVDRYLSVPMTPQRFSFRGGTMVGEEHYFNLGNGTNVGPTYRFWPRSKPVVSVEDLKVYVTNSQYVDFSTDELFVAHDHIAVTSLTITSIGLFGNFSVPIIGLTQPIARIDYTYGQTFPETDEYLEVTDGLTFRAQNQFWTDAAVTVKLDGNIITTGFTVDRDEGTIVFDEAQAADAVIQASYTYGMYPEIGQAVGLCVAGFIGDKQLVEKGMTGVQSLRVGDIAIDRPRPRAATSNISVDLPDEAKQLLNGLEFVTIR